jgi:AcrR family transcriptional regulator
VAKTTIYRRYRDKAALVAAAVERRAPAKPPQPGGESLRADVHALAAWLARSISEQDVGLLGARDLTTSADQQTQVLIAESVAVLAGHVSATATALIHRCRPQGEHHR